jgi:hypothetical protein
VQNLVGHQVVQDQRHSGCRVDGVRYPENGVSPDVDVLGVPIDFGHHRHAIPWREAGHVVTQRVNQADHRVAGHERRLLLEGAAALPGLHVDQAHTRRLHPHPNLVRPGVPQLPLDDLQHLGASPAGCHHTSIRGHLSALLLSCGAGTLARLQLDVHPAGDPRSLTRADSCPAGADALCTAYLDLRLLSPEASRKVRTIRARLTLPLWSLNRLGHCSSPM